MSTLNIEELNVDDDTKQGLKKLNIDEVASSQQDVITYLSEGRGLIVKSNPKEKASIAALSALGLSFNQADEDGPNCLILSSSSKQVKTIGEQITKFGAPDITWATMDEQMEAQQKKTVLDKKPNILIATPCTLQKTMRKMRYVFRSVHYVILDGFDEMNTAVHRYCLKRIRLRTLSDYKSLIFSSKLDDKVKKLSSHYVENPVTIGFEDPSNSQQTSPPDLLDSLKQGYINVPPRMKISTLMALVQQSKAKKTVIFTASKRGTDRLYKILKKQKTSSLKPSWQTLQR